MPSNAIVVDPRMAGSGEFSRKSWIPLKSPRSVDLD
jgi:hypothetical protein